LNASITRAPWRRHEHKTGRAAISPDPLEEAAVGAADEKTLK
jgi:hypothetical protein